MTPYVEYRLTADTSYRLKDGYVARWIAAEIAAGRQPTKSQVANKYNDVSITVSERWRSRHYGYLVTTEVHP